MPDSGRVRRRSADGVPFPLLSPCSSLSPLLTAVLVLEFIRRPLKMKGAPIPGTSSPGGRASRSTLRHRSSKVVDRPASAVSRTRNAPERSWATGQIRFSPLIASALADNDIRRQAGDPSCPHIMSTAGKVAMESSTAVIHRLVELRNARRGPRTAGRSASQRTGSEPRRPCSPTSARCTPCKLIAGADNGNGRPRPGRCSDGPPDDGGLRGSPTDVAGGASRTCDRLHHRPPDDRRTRRCRTRASEAPDRAPQ
jgi:hypothetical protein